MSTPSDISSDTPRADRGERMSAAVLRNWLMLALAIAILDQGTKWLALTTLDPRDPIRLLPFLDLRLAFNPGAAFSFLGDAGGWQRWFFIAVAAVISVFLFFWLRGEPRAARWVPLALALVLGGALGNVVDRVRTGLVVDFIDFHYAGWHWPAFNVADTAICIGAAMLVVDAFRPAR